MANGQASTAITPYQQKVNDVRGMLERAKSQIKLALPSHMTPDRMLRIAMTSIQKNPALLDCDRTSLVAAIIQSAQLGLEPDGALGMAYLVPYGKTVTFIPGYRGLVDLARRSGQLSTISAHVVYKKDVFKYARGTDQMIEHVPCDEDDPGEMTHAYAVAKLRDGGVQFEVMTRREVLAIKARSKASNSGPWKTDEAEMWKKTAIRRLAKLLPMSVEMARAVELDERTDAGLPQDFGDIIDTTATEEKPAPRTTGDLLEGGAA